MIDLTAAISRSAKDPRLDAVLDELHVHDLGRGLPRRRSGQIGGHLQPPHQRTIGHPGSGTRGPGGYRVGRRAAPDATQAAALATAPPRAGTVRREAELVDERDRLAREVHDVVSHTLGAVSIQLTALDSRIAAGDGPEEVRERIEAIHRLVGDGLGEARDAVRALRDDARCLAGRLEGLCRLHDATFEVDGAPGSLRPDAALALYRVAQEAVTNAAKHAAGAAVTVRLCCDEQVARVRIDNDGRPSGTHSPISRAGGGYGVLGMRERVELVGGRLQAGPHDGGWRVSAEIPTR